MSEQDEMKESGTSCTAPSLWRKRALNGTTQKERSLSKSEQPSRRLTQEELNAWWPFNRLDPKRFPKNLKTTFSHSEEDDAPI